MTATFMNARPRASEPERRGEPFSLRRWIRRWRAARRLSELEALDDRLLADIGLRRDQLTPELLLSDDTDGDASRRTTVSARLAIAG